MKKFLYIFIAAVLILTAVPVSAEGAYPRLMDNADLLTDSEEVEISCKLDEISELRQMDIVICTLPSLGEYSPDEYADALFEYCSYGIGSERSCIMFLISMEYSDWYILRAGDGIDALTDTGIDYIEDNVIPMMSDGNFAGAFLEFADLCELFIGMEQNGNPFDEDDIPKEPFDITSSVVISLIIGVIGGLIVTGYHKSKLKSVRKQPSAKDYTKRDSFNLTESKDIYLYRTVTKHEKPKNTGGSSSIRTTSSGTRVSGRGGKF